MPKTPKLTPQDIRDALLTRNAEHLPEFWVTLTEAEVEDCASGYVPKSVKARLRAMLDWQEEDRRRAQRPVCCRTCGRPERAKADA